MSGGPGNMWCAGASGAEPERDRQRFARPRDSPRHGSRPGQKPRAPREQATTFIGRMVYLIDTGAALADAVG
jgi:hypothetical protein